MAAQDDVERLRAELALLRTERDAAIRALERAEAAAEEQHQLLVEEQDRFVSRLIEGHEREIGRLRLEAEEAVASNERLKAKFERDKAHLVKLEENLLRARMDAERLRAQRDQIRDEVRRMVHSGGASQALVDELRRELSLARSMLHDAMQGPRDSGVVRPRPSGRVRHSTPPGTPRQREHRSEAPRAAAAGTGTDRDGPPSSR